MWAIHFILRLISPLTAGLIKMAYCAERDEEFHVSTVLVIILQPIFSNFYCNISNFSLVMVYQSR
jgi:hypothetical protein